MTPKTVYCVRLDTSGPTIVHVTADRETPTMFIAPNGNRLPKKDYFENRDDAIVAALDRLCKHLDLYTSMVSDTATDISTLSRMRKT